MPSKKVLEAKQKIVENLADEFSQAQSIVFADYRGLTVAEDTEMRTAIRKTGVTYQVIKNSLSSRALEKAGLEGLEDILQGPTAVAYSKDEIIAPSRVLKNFEKKFDRFQIKGGVIEGRVATLEDINRLATIPEPEVLYSQLVFGLLYPITSLAIVLNAIKEKKEGGATGEETAEVAATAEATL